MSHVRTQLRDHIVAELIDANIAGVGTKIHSGRIRPFGEDRLPAIAVYVRSETVRASARRADANAIRRERTVSVVIEVYAQMTSALDDALDAIALAVEVRMMLDRTAGGIAKNFEPSGTEIGVADEAQQKTGVARLTFTAEIHTDDRAPDQPLA